MQRQIYYDRDSIDISYTWLNLGLCYRHLNDLGKTADCYQKWAQLIYIFIYEIPSLTT